MSTVIIDNSVSAEKFQAIQSLVEKEVANNPNLNGMDFTFEKGDSTWIDCNDSNDPALVGLLYKINDLISGYYD